MSGSVLDQAMNEVSDKRWSVRLLPVPDTFAKEREVNNSIADFVAGVCRPLDPQVVKSVAVLFDSHVSIPEFASTSTLTKPVAENNVSILPSPIQFAMPPPNTAKVEIIVDNSGDGFVSVLKFIYFEKPVPTNIALKLCSGHAHVPVFRQGPWTVKKGIQRALSKVAGSHVRWHVLEDKHEKRLQRSASAQWSPEDDELSAGIRYINEHAPECDGLNEQTYWILTNIKTDSGSPVAGWPEVKVRSMCQNKSRGVSGAVPQMEFPLTTYSLRLPFVEHVLPLIYPLLMSTAILMLGTPGVGKTPAIIAMCMAIGRYHVRRLQLQGVKPGWRRAKSLDNFRQRAPQIQEALFLDDPSRRRSDIADLKAFFTSDEDRTVSGRYNDARTARNQMRAMASNDSGKEPSDVLPSDTTLNSGAFFELINPLFHDDHIKDILAVMKRVTTLVFTSGKGSEGHSLAVQGCALLLRLAGVPLSSIHILLDMNHKAVERIEKSLAFARKAYVESHQKSMSFGFARGKKWMEVEADEAVFDKFLLPAEDSPARNRMMQWEQWLGMVARGKPSSLVLIRLPCVTTRKRAPGPGAIKKVHWTKIANTWLKGRNIILHTDSARSYKAKVAGVLHDSVVHQKKRVWKGGKWIWQPPTFVRLARHTLPDGRRLTLKAGTQVVDRAWRFIKDRLKINQNVKRNSTLLQAKIRSAQFEYWHKGKDAWTSAGELFTWYMGNITEKF